MDESEPNFILDEKLCQRSVEVKNAVSGCAVLAPQKKICKDRENGSATHFPSDTTPLPVTTPDWGLGGPWLGSFGVNFLITNSCRILAAAP